MSENNKPTLNEQADSLNKMSYACLQLTILAVVLPILASIAYELFRMALSQ